MCGKGDRGHCVHVHVRRGTREEEAACVCGDFLVFGSGDRATAETEKQQREKNRRGGSLAWFSRLVCMCMYMDAIL